MATENFLNANIADKAVVKAIGPNSRVLGMNLNEQVVFDKTITLVTLNSTDSTKWDTSTASVAYVTPRAIVAKGFVKSLIDSNTSACFAFPKGFKAKAEQVVKTTVSGSEVATLTTNHNEGPYGTVTVNATADTGNDVYLEGLVFLAENDQTPNPYQAAYIYNEGDECTSGGATYASLQNANVGNTPASSPTYWEVVSE